MQKDMTSQPWRREIGKLAACLLTLGVASACQPSIDSDASRAPFTLEALEGARFPSPIAAGGEVLARSTASSQANVLAGSTGSEQGQGQDPDATPRAGSGRRHGAPLSRRPRTVELASQGILIDGHYTLLRGGSVQWFRIPEEAWEERLRRYAATGFNALDIYIAWNVVEPEEGHFNFESPNLARFLELCQQFGLYVAVRPGPFITNEMDGGGLPGWLLRRATKRGTGRDGLFNIRTDDPDFMQATGRYLQALGKVLEPYYATRGGPIVLYTIENEYTWFHRAFRYDKLFALDGQPERPLWAELDIASYMTLLRDQVRASGCDVPIATSPGDAQVSATGDVSDVAPFASIYEWATPKQPEDAAYDLIQDMHDPAAHGGVYADMPGGSSEVARSTQEFRRLFSGGLDVLFGFNMAGLIQQGYLNSMTLAARAGDQPPHWGPPGEPRPDWVSTIYDFTSYQRIVTGFAAPKFAYFHNVLDYDGVLSPSGTLRPLFHRFRRENLFYDTVESMLAPLGLPHRSGQVPNAHPGLSVHAPALGTHQESGHTHYWFEAADGSTLLFLVNQSGSPQPLRPGDIELGPLRFPRFTQATVPISAESNPTYAQALVQHWPIAEGVRLDYSTSELLTLRDLNQDRLLVLYGVAGTTGELSLRDSQGDWQVEHADPDLRFHERGPVLTVSYTHAADRFLVLLSSKGQRVRVIVTTREEAGHFWFPRVDGQDVLVAGPHWVEPDASFVETTGRESRFLVVASAQPSLEGWQARAPQHPITGARLYDVPDTPEPPALTVNLQWGRSRSDLAEVEPSYDDSDWIHWEGEAAPLEDLDIHRGHAWYRAELDLNGALGWFNRGHLRVEQAGDIVGVYVNGHYLTTLLPAGTEIDSGSPNIHYRFPSPKPYLRKGRNVIAFRTEIWGHGSFMFGRGRLLGRARLPGVGYEGLKGLHGSASLGGHALTRWSARADLSGERTGFDKPDFDDRGWTPTTLPMRLEPGAVRWYRTRFSTADLPDPEHWIAPVSGEFKGSNCKATLFLNGHLIGRWLSDEGWLQRGVWARAQRNMWNLQDPDHFPFPYELLRKDGEPNVLAIAFEDSSGDHGPAGEVQSLQLIYNREHIEWRAGARLRKVAASLRRPLRMRFSQ